MKKGGKKQDGVRSSNCRHWRCKAGCCRETSCCHAAHREATSADEGNVNLASVEIHNSAVCMTSPAGMRKGKDPFMAQKHAVLLVSYARFPFPVTLHMESFRWKRNLNKAQLNASPITIGVKYSCRAPTKFRVASHIH